MFGAIIIIIAIIIFLLAIKFTWHSLSDLDNMKKVFFILIGSAVNFLIALIIFNLSKRNIDYDVNILKKMKDVLVSIIMPLNMLVTLPFLANTIDKIKYQEIEDNKVKNRIVLFIIFIIILGIVEVNYLENIQVGAMQIFENLSK